MLIFLYILGQTSKGLPNMRTKKLSEYEYGVLETELHRG